MSKFKDLTIKVLKESVDEMKSLLDELEKYGSVTIPDKALRNEFFDYIVNLEDSLIDIDDIRCEGDYLYLA